MPQNRTKALSPALAWHFDEDHTDPYLVRIWVTMGDTPPQLLWFRSHGTPLVRSGDALLCLGLPPSMELGVPLVLQASLSRKLHATAPRIRRMLCDWYPGLAETPLQLPTPSPPPHLRIQHRKTALFFSAGVDSSFSLAVAQAEIDCMVTVIGADVPVGDSSRANRLHDVSRQIAHAYRKEFICIETNVREIFNRWIGWVEYHGAVLAAIAHMLSSHIERALIASSADASSWLRPWGSHPGLDPLWSNEILSIEHHALVPRARKIQRLLAEPVLMNHLRVCDYDDQNCGTCPDCEWMLATLGILDAYQFAPTFPKNDARIKRLIIDGLGTRSDMLDLRIIAQQNDKPEMVQKIDSALIRFHRRQRIERLIGLSNKLRKWKRFKRQMRYRRALRKAKK